MSVVLAARDAFGERFARRLALNAGMPTGLIISIVGRPIHKTGEAVVSHLSDRRKEQR